MHGCVLNKVPLVDISKSWSYRVLTSAHLFQRFVSIRLRVKYGCSVNLAEWRSIATTYTATPLDFLHAMSTYEITQSRDELNQLKKRHVFLSNPFAPFCC